MSRSYKMADPNKNFGDLLQERFLDKTAGESGRKPVGSAVILIVAMAVVNIIVEVVCATIFEPQLLAIVHPVLAAIDVFFLFSYWLWARTKEYLFGEIGFIYLAIALAYTISPAIKFLQMDIKGIYTVDMPISSPSFSELGTHFWRCGLFIFGVALGYLIIRGRGVGAGTKPGTELSEPLTRRLIITWILIIVGCACIVLFLSTAPTTYVEHYTRFEKLPKYLGRVVLLSQIFRGGGYFILMALMFSRYRRYKWLIFISVPLICLFEVSMSLGSRIVAFTIVMAFLGFYHYRVKSIPLLRGGLVLAAVATLFIGIEIIRASQYDLRAAQDIITSENIRGSEFEAVYYTGLHLYAERALGTLPRRDWKMFFYDFLAIVPFIDHKADHPQYWYARHYYPEAVVPPMTLGIIADSAIWGGEWDLFLRSLINGAVFALLARWFQRRKTKWWALVIYVYCFATCIITLKYSVFYHLTPLAKEILPSLILTGMMIVILNGQGLRKAPAANGRWT